MDIWASQTQESALAPAPPTPFHQQHTTPNTNIYIILYYYYIIISVTIHQSMIYTKTTTLSLSTRSAAQSTHSQFNFCSLFLNSLSIFGHMIRVLLALLKIISMGVVKGGAVKIVIYSTEMLDKLKGHEPNAQCTPPQTQPTTKNL